MRNLSLMLALLAAACASDYGAAVLLTIHGDVAGPGGAYRIEMRRPDGSEGAGFAPGTVDFQPGEQEVALILDDDSIFRDSDTLLMRVYVEVLPQPASSKPLALGSALVTLERGGTVDLAVTARADPRPITQRLVAGYAVGEAGAQLVGITAAPALSLASYALHFWTQEAGGTRWVGAASSLADSVSIAVSGGALISRAGVALLVTAEPDGGTDALARSNGWLLATGSLDEELRQTLDLLLAEGGTLARLAALAQISGQHAIFARSALVNDNQAGALMHAEHVFNTVGEDSDLTNGDFTGDGVEENVRPDGETHGMEHYRLEVYNRAQSVAERAPDGSAIFGVLERCATALANAISGTLASADAYSGSAGDSALMQALVDSANDLSGAAYDPSAALDDPDQTLDCLRNRTQALSSFELLAETP